MFTQVQLLEDEIVAMERQLEQLNVAVDVREFRGSSSGSNTTCEQTQLQQQQQRQQQRLKRRKINDVISNTDKRLWQLTVTRVSDAFSYETSIQNISDILVFLRETLRYFSIHSPDRTPAFHVDRREHSLTVTNKVLVIEGIIWSFFTSKKEDERLSTPPPHASSAMSCTTLKQQTTFFKIHCIEIYFSCIGLVNPVLVQPYYEQYLKLNPSCMLADAIAAYIGYAQCQHIAVPIHARLELAESCRENAKTMLREILFEDEPNVEVLATLLFLALSSLILLRNNEGRTYISLAWTMCMQLRSQYLPVLRDTNCQDERALAEAESWRRIFYMVRDLEISMHIVYDGHGRGVSSALLHDDIGQPTPVPCEAANDTLRSAVEVYCHIIRLNDCHASTKLDEIGYRLLSGSMDTIACTDVEFLENQMFGLWQSLPSEYRLANGPMEYVQLDRVQQCQNPQILYLNKLYYCYWLALETRLMQDPTRTNLVGASLARMDGDRALLIVSICCDAAAKIFQVLRCRLACVLDLHWVMIASDAMRMLMKSANPRIQFQAKRNFQEALNVLCSFIHTPNSPYNNNNNDCNDIPCDSCSIVTATSSSTSSSTCSSFRSTPATATPSFVDDLTSDDLIDAKVSASTPTTTASSNSQSMHPTPYSVAPYFVEVKKALDMYLFQTQY